MIKKFEDIRIVACLMGHDDDNYIDLVLDDLEKYTNEIYVNLNDATKTVEKAVLKRLGKGVEEVIYTTNSGLRWSQGKVRDDTISMLDDIRPDIVLFPDSDETYPKNLKEQLRVFWEDEEKVTFWFRLLYMWDDNKHYRNDGIFRTIHHVRAFKWQPNITYLPKYAGYACPTSFRELERKTQYHSTAPTFHWGYMLEEDRIRKYKRAGRDYTKGTQYQREMDKDKLILEVPTELF